MGVRDLFWNLVARDQTGAAFAGVIGSGRTQVGVVMVALIVERLLTMLVRSW
ncbi:MAG: hypothetical protein ACI8Q6_003597 [Granulosicoccus sp.]|jgi:hypothetical protein